MKKNIDQDNYRLHRLVQSEYLARMENLQEEFEAATKLLLDKFPSQRDSTFDDDQWLLFERYVPQVLALARNFNESQKKSSPLIPNMDFVHLLTNAAKCIPPKRLLLMKLTNVSQRGTRQRYGECCRRPP